jgi:putative tricarboxylic transport membrane protein
VQKKSVLKGLMKQDRQFGIAVLIICGLLFAETITFPTRPLIPLGVAFWPRLVLGCLILAGLILVVRGSLDNGPFEKLQPKAFIAVGGCMIYLLFLDFVGYLILTPIFLFAGSCALAWSVKPRQLVTATIMAVAGTSVTYYLFYNVLSVQLPEGLLY